MVLLLLGIAAALVIPSFEPNVAGQLQAAAEVVRADIQYVRRLSVSNNSTYSITFDTSANTYAIQHSGTNPTLDTLPRSMAFTRDTGGTRYLISLANSQNTGTCPCLYGVRSGDPATSTTSFSFDSLGSPVPVGDVEIWLTAGAGDSKRYLQITIHAATGLATVGSITNVAPSS